MSLLDQSFTAPSLLTHRRLTFSRSRPGATETDTETGDSIPGNPSTGSVQGWFSLMPTVEANNHKDAASAYVLTRPGQLQAGDRITHATLGTFEVTEDSPLRQGGHDRCNLKKALSRA